MGSDREWLEKRLAVDPDYAEVRRARRRAYKKAHRKEITKQVQRRRKEDPVFREKENARARKKNFRRRLKRYGLSVADYELMVADQGGVCRICKTKPEKRLCVDHCHKKKKVRRLLCSQCNSMIGFGRDDPAILDEGAAYLREFSGDEGERAAAATPAALDFWAVCPADEE
jgi:hypothetical protein